MRTVVPTTDHAAYISAWDAVSKSGSRHWNLDAWAAGHRYLSLTALVLTDSEVAQLRQVTQRFSRLIDVAVSGILADPDWWSALAWPWPAIELARQEPAHPGGQASLYGRFDCLIDANGTWQVIEYNADTPSGGREASGLEPAVARLHPYCARINAQLASHLRVTMEKRLKRHTRPVHLIGIISSHSWVEDMSQAHWLAALLRKSGFEAIVGDVTDLSVTQGWIALRGRRLDALYRFYPIERLYRHAIFASLLDATIDGKLLLLNGLRGFLAQSKACLAWLWANRRLDVQRHLPETFMARDPEAEALVADSVVKHVNGREGDSVVFGRTLDAEAWEARRLEGGYVVQRVVPSPSVMDVMVDDHRKEIRCEANTFACVGAFAVGGGFAGCYTRLDGPITSPRARFAVTLRERTSARSRSNVTRLPPSSTE